MIGPFISYAPPGVYGPTHPLNDTDCWQCWERNPLDRKYGLCKNEFGTHVHTLCDVCHAQILMGLRDKRGETWEPMSAAERDAYLVCSEVLLT